MSIELSQEVTSQAIEEGITEHQSMEDILKYIQPRSVVLFDLDNTLIKSPIDLGGDFWFMQLFSYAISRIPDPKVVGPIVVAIYNEILQIVRNEVVEQRSVRIIKELQEKGIPVIAITARDQEEATVRQLADNGFAFKDSYGFKPQQLAELGVKRPFYANGIIYCSGLDKGLIFTKFMEATKIPLVHVLMVDDRRTHLESIHKVLNSLNIPFHGIRYGRLDEKAAEFNFEESNQQLESVYPRLSENIKNQVDSLELRPKTSSKPRDDYGRFFYAQKANSEWHSQFSAAISV